MRRATLATLLLILVMMLIARGCTHPAPIKTADQGLTMLSGDWVLKQLHGADVSSLLGPGGRPPTLSFAEDGRVSGFSGVNRLTSTLDVDRLTKSEFKLSPVASTRMAGPPEAMALESKFNQALNEATGFKFEGNDLSLTRGAETLLQFARGS